MLNSALFLHAARESNTSRWSGATVDVHFWPEIVRYLLVVKKKQLPFSHSFVLARSRIASNFVLNALVHVRAGPFLTPARMPSKFRAPLS